MMPVKKKRALPALLAVGVSLAILASAAAAFAADNRRGVYIGVELGVANPSDLSSTLSGVNHPTRCDSLLYSDSSPIDDALANSDACQDTTPRTLSDNAFELDMGFMAGASVGYRLDRFRVEFEYMNRSHDGSSSDLQSPSGNQALAGKNAEWARVPSERISDFVAHQFFVNAYYDVLNDSRWTPYIGGGVGLARTSMRYRNSFVRKPDGEYLALSFDPDWSDAAKRAAAGTISFWETDVADTIFGFQFMGGLDYALTDNVSIGVKGRWARFGEISHSGTWNLIRSHAPVRADGTTPFTSSLEIDDIEYWAMTLGLKYHF